MYASHFGLTAKPFSIVPNPDILFLSENHQNTLTMLEYGLSERTGFVLLTGEIGTGKTTLIRYMLNEMVSQMDVAVIFNTNFDSDQLYRMILSEFDIPCDVTEKDRQMEMLFRFLIDRYAQGLQTLLVIDEAQHLPDETLEDIRMLTNLQTDDQLLLQIILVGQPELRTRLEAPKFKQLAQRIGVNYHLDPFDREQTDNYINHRVTAAGGRADLFSPEAIELIHDHSGGIPRTINLLCDAVLVYGYADGLKRIDRDAVEKVLADKVCLAASSSQKNPHAAEATGANGDIHEVNRRLAVVEKTLVDLGHRFEAIHREIKCEMYVKYQEMLTAERERFRQIVENTDNSLSKQTGEDEQPFPRPSDTPPSPARISFSWLFSPFSWIKAKK